MNASRFAIWIYAWECHTRAELTDRVDGLHARGGMNESRDLTLARRAVTSLAIVLASVNAYAESGRVLDQRTGLPIAGAHVFAQWKAQVMNPVDSKTVCYFFATVQSGPNGEYSLAEPPLGALRFGLMHRSRELSAYSPGYVPSARKIPSEPGTMYMLRDPRTTSERIKGLKPYEFSRCVPKAERGVLGPLYARLAEEAKNLAITAEDRRIALNLRHNAEEVLLSPEEYQRRFSSGEYGK